ncbi:GNAT family N-acetyltransferase [Chromobacterium alticapitis]|uniref:GNAT family N-acetyltransferase n=1 Tax=Chromobacterium alticapitis TaxID=2073169 RepID=A0A2S5DDS3_9NEIS|nr:GNAT family N-acetyltransferase [Chromobacterium alticapitis]POZ61138.1 GNAT family N-acetyltransferase [Chromobacterium alticapitis]
MFTLRPLTESDSIEQLTTLLHRAYAQLAAMGLRYTAVDQSPDVTRRRIRGGHCLLAWHQNALAGTVTVHGALPTSQCPQFRHPDTAVLVQLAVDPEYQGLGLGEWLMRAAEDWASAQGCAAIRLDTARDAIHLVSRYQRRGYRMEAPLQWPDKAYQSVVMVKSLETPRPGEARTGSCSATN